MDEPATAPWYVDGLRFKCTQCGKCCTGAPGYVWITPEEIASMAEHLNISEDEFKRKYIRQKDNRYALIEMKERNYDCVFLKDGKCHVYQCRPRQCRTFPWWKENLSSPEQWTYAASACEGINDLAPIVSFDRIESALNEP